MSLKLPTKLRYPECTKGQEHEGEVMSRVCIDSKCSNRCLICSICEETEHRGHSTLPVKIYLEKLAEQRHSLETDSSRYQQIAQVTNLREACLTAITNKKREVNQKFSDLQSKIQSYFQKIGATCRGILYARGPAQCLIDEFVFDGGSEPNHIVESFKAVLEIFHNDTAGKPIDVGMEIKSLLDMAVDKEKRLTAALIQISTDLAKDIDPINAIFDFVPASSSQHSKYVWSEKLKGAKIKITDTVAEQTGSESTGQRFILMEPSLFDVSKRKKQWAVKVKKFNGWVGVGISLHKVIQNANFHFNYTVLGHGSYLISSNGYSWSHSIKQFNSTFKCFTFTVNDTIYMEYDPTMGKLRFQKNDAKDIKDKFEMDVVPPPLGDAYHPSANLCNNNDSVQIVQVTKQLIW